MAKVVTSEGLTDFVQTGKVDVVKNDPPLEVKKEPVIQDIKEKPKEEPKKVDDEGLEADDVDLSEHVRKKIGKKHRAMKEAQESALEAERFAENQYNRARLAEQKAAEVEAQLKELQAKGEKPKEPEAKKPDPQSFMDDKGQFKAFEYAEALAAFSANEAVAKDRAKQDEERRNSEAQKAADIAKARVSETIKKHPDYETVMAEADVKTHNAVLQYLSGSEHIGEVSYYLAKHPDFVERINKLNPLKAIAEIGKLELTFEPKEPEKSEPVQKVSGAPAPITPLNSSGSVNTNTDPSKMSYKELRAYERARARKR